MILTKINNLTLNLNHMGVPKLIKECIIGIDSQEKLKMVINIEAKNIKITVNGENDQKSSHSKTDLEIQDNVNNKFDVSIEGIEKKP